MLFLQVQTELPECARGYLHHGTASSYCSRGKRSSVQETLLTNKHQRCEGCIDHEPHSCGDSEAPVSNGDCLTCQTGITPDKVQVELRHSDRACEQITSESIKTDHVPSEPATQPEPTTLKHLPFHKRYAGGCAFLAEYLEKESSEEYFAPYLLPEKFLKRVWVMDLVTENDTHSCCFTKRYACKYSLFSPRTRTLYFLIFIVRMTFARF